MLRDVKFFSPLLNVNNVKRHFLYYKERNMKHDARHEENGFTSNNTSQSFYSLSPITRKKKLK